MDFAVQIINESMFPPSESERSSRAPPTMSRGPFRDQSRANADSTDLYWPLVTSAVELFATLSCEAIVRPELFSMAVGPVPALPLACQPPRSLRSLSLSSFSSSPPLSPLSAAVTPSQFFVAAQW